MKKHSFRSLSVRLPLLFVASTLIIMGFMVPLVYQRFHNRMIDQYSRMAQGVTQLMVNAVDGDRAEEFMEKNFALPEYVDTVDYLYTLRDNYPDILYMYVYRFEKDGGHVIIDLDADWWENGEGYEPGFIWTLDELEEPFVSHLDEVMAGKELAGYSELTREDGYLFTYTRPIFRSDGSYACTACVDFSMDTLWGMDKAFTLGRPRGRFPHCPQARHLSHQQAVPLRRQILLRYGGGPEEQPQASGRSEHPHRRRDRGRLSHAPLRHA